jgi:transcription termination factor Rho
MSEQFAGVLDVDPRRFGFVRDPRTGFPDNGSSPFVPPGLIARYRLRAGVMLEGTAVPKPEKSPQVNAITSINGMTPEAWGRVVEFTALRPISPRQIIRLEGKKSNVSMRIVDLFCPVGKGQRALIVSPPKAGKTMLMQQFAHAISYNNPGIDLLVLLIDERPEEVTDMQRSIKGEVFASSSDSERGRHVHLAQLVLEYAKRKVETGRDVVLLLDSLTRLGRAFNLHQRSSGRTLSGGVDARALEIPKRIFGAARQCEDSGSLTIIATALVETGSRMDELIFQEFKGTGNMELVLSRDLANERIFPALNLNESGTRGEGLLFGPNAGRHQALRRSLARKSERDAMLAVLKLMEQYPTNEMLLERVESW